MCFTASQQLLLQSTPSPLDIITQFGLRPFELLELFPRIFDYYDWFTIEDSSSGSYEIFVGLTNQWTWTDVLGRRVCLREQAYHSVLAWLKSINSERLNHNHSKSLRINLIKFIETCIISKHSPLL